MSDTNSAAAAQGKTVKNKRNKNKNKREKRQKTDINERVLTHPFRLLSAEKEVCLSMVGLDGAGKTTILKKLGVNVQEIAFDGCHMEALVHDNITINAWDLSGIYENRNPGRHIFENTKGLIFVVDSTDTEDRLDQARDELHNMLNQGFLRTDVPLLVLANKQDKPKAMKNKISGRLGVTSTLVRREWRVVMTSAITCEGLYEGLDWLCERISYACAVSSEAVSRSLNLLKETRTNKIYDDDMPIGYTFRPSDEDFIHFIVMLKDGHEIYPERVRRANLFERHPAHIIRDLMHSDHPLRPCMLGRRKCYLFYCQVPDEQDYIEGYGYVQIQDQSKGVWLPNRYSEYFLCDQADDITRCGEEQGFIYRPVNETSLSCWKMTMYSLADLPRPKSNMVICKVYESEISKNNMKLKSIAERREELEEFNSKWSAETAKISLIEQSIIEAKKNQESYKRKVGAGAYCLLNQVQDYERNEFKEEDEIDEPSGERTNAQKIAEALKIVKRRRKKAKEAVIALQGNEEED